MSKVRACSHMRGTAASVHIDQVIELMAFLPRSRCVSRTGIAYPTHCAAVALNRLGGCQRITSVTRK